MTNRVPAGLDRVLTATLVVAVILNALQCVLTIRAEQDRPDVHWGAPGFADAAAAIGDAQEVVFITDEAGLADANGRIHSCQFALIPARLIVKHHRPEVLAAIDQGMWCIMDARLPASVDTTEEKTRAWAESAGRELIFKRLSPRLAVFRSPPAEKGENK